MAKKVNRAHKTTDPLTDILKAKAYLEREIKRLQSDR